jgi:hypothetical protein
VEELRTELLGGESASAPSQRRVVVLRGHVDALVRDALSEMAGVDGAFIDAHAHGRPYRPRTNRPPRWWTWKYPEVAAGQVPVYKPGGQALTISRMSLWTGAVPILLVGHQILEKPRLRHEDAVVAASGYGSMGGYMFPSTVGRTEMSSFEQDLWEALCRDADVEAVLGELVYERWTSCLAAVRLEVSHADEEQKSLWRAMGALEANLDEARVLFRRGKQLEAVCVDAWADMIRRLEMRIQLRQPGVGAETHRASLAGTSTWQNDGSLDRIAYLGGLLLPVTVVASILSIEGEYGPEGDSFWVFWTASFLASVLVVMIIYADQLRTVEVWFEVGEIDEEDLPDEGEGGWEAARYLVQRWTDGSKGRTWRKGSLGWSGAVKKMTGYYSWRRDPRLEFRRPGDVVRPRRA